jgi:hypothetical protein
MDASTLTTLLFIGKWLLIGLVYLFLFQVVLTVRREMAQRVSERPMMPQPPSGILRVVQPGTDERLYVGQVLPLQATTSLGSESDNDIVLHDTYVSRRHASLRWDGKAWWVEDLGSRNGTFLNDILCPPYKAQLAPAGSLLKIGNVVFEIAD